MTLPDHLFFTGVPGSRWSGVAQILETLPGFNISDRKPERVYEFQDFSSHLGSYFGKGMEFDSDIETWSKELINQYIDSPWANGKGTRIVKSHDWAYKLPLIKKLFPDDWIMLVYRPDVVSSAWWHGAGGFKITYPKYDWYKDSTNMMCEIQKQNAAILEYAYTQDATWNHFTSKWIKDTFGEEREAPHKFHDMLVTIIK